MQKINVKQKIALTLMLTAILSASLINVAVSDIVYVSSNTNFYSYTDMAATAGAGVKWEFTGNNYYLTMVTVWVDNTNTGTSGVLQAILYDGDRTSNTTIETSTSIIDMSAIPNLGTSPTALNQFTQVTFAFSGDTLLMSAHGYSMGIVSLNLTHGWQIARAQTGNNAIRANWGSAWTGGTGQYLHMIFGNSIPTTATPSPSPSPTPVNDYKWDENANQWYWWNGTHWVISNGPTPTANAQIAAFTNDLISFLVALVCIVALGGVLGWKFGLWGFVAGANIGIFLCYFYLGLPIWAVIGILIVDGLLFFATRGKE